jgi:hypothetical protein
VSLTKHSANNKLTDNGPEGDDPIGHLARKAREELRQQAPRDGVARLEEHRQTQLRRRAATAAGVAALLVVVGLAVRVNRNGDDRISPATTKPATTTPSALDNFIITDTGASAAAAADPASRCCPRRDHCSGRDHQAGRTWSGLGLFRFVIVQRRTPRVDADIAGMPRCEALRAAGKGMSPTGGTASPLVAFASGSLGNAIQRTFVFPTVEAASRQMDLIADRRWMACLAAIWDTNIPKLTPDVKRSTTIPANLSPPTPRGDRLITTSFMSLFEQATAGTRRFNMVSFVQVGRVIVNVIANPTMSDNTDPRNLIDKSLIAAVEAARSALAAP